MSVSRLVCSLLIVVGAAACSSDDIPGPPAGLQHAVATPSCGPADGPAVAIYLASAPVESLRPSAPYVLIHVWQPLERLRGRSWSLAPNQGEGGASFHRTAADFEAATGGRVTVSAVARDNTIEGSVHAIFPKAGRISGGFRAAWVTPPSLLCG